jgi:cytochrome c biogenesis protein
MTHEVNSRPLPPAATPAPAAAASPSVMDRVDNVLEGLWHLLSSMRVAMIIMLAIAALGVAGSLLMQMPPEALADPQRRELWIESVRPRYGALTDVFATLQLFEVFASILFRVLVAALTISLIACSVHRIPGVIRTARNPRIDVGPAFFEHAPQHEAIVARRSADDTRGIVEGVLKGRRYRVLATDDGTVHLYADRFRWAPASGLVGHLSLVLILIGAIIGGMYGYRNPEFMVSEGETLPVAAEAGLALQVLDFTDKYDPATGRPIDYASQVVLYKDGQEVDRHTVRVNDPLRYGGVTFYQAFYGASAIMTVKDTDGNVVLEAAGVPLAYSTDDGHKFGMIAIPGTPYSAEVTGTAGGSDPDIKPGQVGFGIYTTGATSFTDSKVIDQGEPTQVGDLTVTFEREAQFTGLNVARDPGVMIVWTGALLLFFGFLVRFMVPHKRIWGRISGRGATGAVVQLATLTQKDVTAGTEFENLVNDIRTALNAPAKQA